MWIPQVSLAEESLEEPGAGPRPVVQRAAQEIYQRRKALKKTTDDKGRTVVLKVRQYFSNPNPGAITDVSHDQFITALRMAVERCGSVNALANKLGVVWRIVYKWLDGHGPTRARMQVLLPQLQTLCDGLPSIDQL